MRSAGAIIIQSNLAGEGHCCCATPPVLASACMQFSLCKYSTYAAVTSDSSVQQATACRPASIICLLKPCFKYFQVLSAHPAASPANKVSSAVQSQLQPAAQPGRCLRCLQFKANAAGQAISAMSVVNDKVCRSHVAECDSLAAEPCKQCKLPQGTKPQIIRQNS